MQPAGDTPIETLLDALADGALVLDAHGVVLHANLAAGRILTSPAHALIGQPCAFPVPARGTAEHALPSATVLALEIHPITWRGAAARFVVLRPASKGALAGEGAGERAGQRARPSDHIPRLVLRHMPDGDVFVFDRDLRYVLAEGTTMGRHGVDRAQFIGKSLEYLVPEGMLQQIESLYTNALAGQEGQFEIDQDDHVYRVRCVPIYDEQGQIVLGMTMSQDITRLKQVEREARGLAEQLQALLEREQGARAEAEGQRALLQGVLDQAPAMMCILRGPEYIYEYVNDIYCLALGRTGDELLGRSILDVFPELVDAGLDELLHQVYRTGEPFRASEMRVNVDIDQDGTLHEMYFTFSYQPMRDAGGQVSGIVIHAVNNTDQFMARRAVEQKSAEVARLNRELEQRVEELAAANSELESFAHSVSHDLRAPLRRIDSFGQALLDEHADRLDDQGQHYLARIRAATEHMGTLIEDLLVLAQVSRMELQAASTSLSALAREILDRLSELEQGRQVSLRIAPDVDARGDERLLRIALENLLENAWKFTSKKPGATIELGVEERDGERVFFVRDDGAGFDPAYRQKLFRAFERLHSPSDFPGVGIGLATVKRVIDRHGGRIWADGALDRGAVFYFTLPAAPEA